MRPRDAGQTDPYEDRKALIPSAECATPPRAAAPSTPPPSPLRVGPGPARSAATPHATARATPGHSTPPVRRRRPRTPQEPATAPEGLPARRRGAAPARREAAPARGGAAVARVAPPIEIHRGRGRAGGRPGARHGAGRGGPDARRPGGPLPRHGGGGGCSRATARSSPDGTPWAPLSAATVRRQGHPVRLDGELVRRESRRGEAVGECLVASGSPQYGGAGRPGLSLFGVQQLGSFDAISTETVGHGNFARFRMNVNLEISLPIDLLRSLFHH